MTTVGYGDKAPKTIGGRTFALIWMIFSIIFISCFTVSITSQQTMSRLKNKIQGFNDLYNVKVGCVIGSEGADFLTQKGGAVIPFKTMQEGLLAIDTRRLMHLSRMRSS